MANTYLPDQSESFKNSGMKLITDPSSDALITRASQNRKNAEANIKSVVEDGQRGA